MSRSIESGKLHGHGGYKFETPPAVFPEQPWTIDKSESLYNLAGWGAPYFSINAAGHIDCTPTGQNFKIDLFELTNDLIERGHNLPLLIRFVDILQHRIKKLNEAFRRAIEASDYENVFRGVFPVKVCHERHVIEQVVIYGEPYLYGLETGSKPELLIALASCKTEGSLVVCCGYKDQDYVETALLAQQLDTQAIIIIEQIHEVDLVLEAAKKLDIKPLIGVRVKLLRGGDATGDTAKFGLSASDMMVVVRRLQKANMMDSLQLLHFHIGSQVTSISTVKTALKEAIQFYVQLVKLGANMCYLDVGGGMGIDYDGSKTSYSSSVNYTAEEYAAAVVNSIKLGCQKHGLKVPCIISESGRAVASYETVLIFSVTHATQPLAGCQEVVPVATENEHALIQLLYTLLGKLSSFGQVTLRAAAIQEIYHAATHCKEESIILFTAGLITLAERAKIEELFWACCKKCSTLSDYCSFVPEELVNLRKDMAYLFYCNFSVFQSAPDLWAIDQLFPIVPIHRLNEEPTALGTLQDLTCDSDGKIDRFITTDRSEDFKPLLELHLPEAGKPYFLGMFLMGSYQEALGNLHNLYGDTDAVHVELDPENDKGYSIKHVITGDTTEEVLKCMEYDPLQMISSIRTQSEIALKRNRLTFPQYKILMRHFEKALRAYTYLWAAE